MKRNRSLWTRRGLLRTGLTGGVTAAFASPTLLFSTGSPRVAPPTHETPPLPSVPLAWPTQPPELAREMVGVSHGNAARVRELLARWPTLANASWDWGFGDWEDALGAASHVGNREIAQLLLDHGARPSIFSAAMLGQLGVVRALVEAEPGVQATRGPHGISLLRHARAGGEKSQPVVAYLEAVGGADAPAPDATLGDPSELLGRYSFGPLETDTIEVGTNRVGLYMEREGTSARNLEQLSQFEFSPAGAPRVRVRFVPIPATEGSWALEVHDPELVLRARRLLAVPRG